MERLAEGGTARQRLVVRLCMCMHALRSAGGAQLRTWPCPSVLRGHAGASRGKRSTVLKCSAAHSSRFAATVPAPHPKPPGSSRATPAFEGPARSEANNNFDSVGTAAGSFCGCEADAIRVPANSSSRNGADDFRLGCGTTGAWAGKGATTHEESVLPGADFLLANADLPLSDRRLRPRSTNDASVLGPESDYVLVAQEVSAVSSTAPITRLQTQHCPGARLLPARLSQHPALPIDLAFEHTMVEVTNLLSRGGALADLAFLSTGGIAHGEVLSPAESLALHVKALDVMSEGLATTARLTFGSVLPSFLHSVTPVVVRAEELRTRFSLLLKSAECVRSNLRARGEVAAAPARTNLGLAGRGRVSMLRHGEKQDSTSVCVEELLYRQALSTGREAAVDELLGNMPSSAILYFRARLLLEQLALEPLVGDADRGVLKKYTAGFAWRLQEIVASSAGSHLDPVIAGHASRKLGTPQVG